MNEDKSLREGFMSAERKKLILALCIVFAVNIFLIALAQQEDRVPYMLVIGAREAENGTVAVRTRGGEDLGAMPLDDFLARIREEIRSRAR